MKRPKRIVITGAESTGKTKLAEELAEYYHAPRIPEFARTYVENLNRKYTFADVEIIARHQIETMRHLEGSAPMVFFDTWLIITKVWFDRVYGHHPVWLHEAITSFQVDLFLVCDIDLPWIADRVRENGGEARVLLHQAYLNELGYYGFSYEIIRGIGKVRTKNAIMAIDLFLTRE